MEPDRLSVIAQLMEQENSMMRLLEEKSTVARCTAARTAYANCSRVMASNSVPSQAAVTNTDLSRYIQAATVQEMNNGLSPEQWSPAVQVAATCMLCADEWCGSCNNKTNCSKMKWRM